MEETTIAAISTAMSASGIGIVRISGPEAFEIASGVYRSKGGKKSLKNVPSHTIHYGYIYDNEEMVDEVLVMATVLSCDLVNDPDIVAMIAASAALTISGVPFMGPIGAARVGFANGEYVLNPEVQDMDNLRNNPEQRLDLVVAGTKDAVMMVESEAYELTEEEMLG